MTTYYTNPSNYRKIYEQYYGSIPVDNKGRTHDIHHIDGNRDNNTPSNLVAVSIQEHYDIHYAQEDWAACMLIATKMKMPPALISELSRRTQLKRVKDGTHPFIGGEQSRKINRIRSENGEISKISSRTAKLQVKSQTHPFQDKVKAKERALSRVAKGTHNFLGPGNNRKRLEEGTHNSQIEYTCHLCGKIGKGPRMAHHIKICDKG